MSIYNYYNLNNYGNYYRYPNFRAGEQPIDSNAILAKPIEKVSNVIQTSVDTLVPTTNDKDSNEKKSHKTAITVASSVLVLSTLVALLNPKFSSKLGKRMENIQASLKDKIDKNKNKFISNKFYKILEKGVTWTMKGLEFSNNFNSAKDVIFKDFCIGQKEFKSIKNKSIRNAFKNANDTFIGFMEKPYNGITKWFDNISKSTVNRKYKKVNCEMDLFEELMKKYQDKLSSEEKQELTQKLNEIKKLKKHFSKEEIDKRFIEQEKSMENLETEFRKRLKDYTNGFTDKSNNKGEHIGKNMTFWAEEIMMPKRNEFEKQGLEVVEKLVGNDKDKKGLYDEIYDILKPHIKQEDSDLEITLKNLKNKLKKANHSECVEYFDKKRDLVLGGAPTDILTATLGLGISGVAIGTAQDKDERISRALTGAFPIIAGLGASMAFTAMLFSGVQGMIYGALTSVGLSKIGSVASNYIVGNKAQVQNQNLLAENDLNNIDLKNVNTNNPFQPNLKPQGGKNV